MVRELMVEESAFGVPIGTPALRGVFEGADEREPKPGTDYGVGLEWKFRITQEGEFKGRVVSRTTSLKPTPKNACGRMLAGLTGNAAAVGNRVVIANYIGKEYVLMFEPNASGNGTRVAMISPVNGAAPPAGNTNGTAHKAVSSAPPPPPPEPPPDAPEATQIGRFWVVLKKGQPPTLEEAKTVQDFISVEKPPLNKFYVCPEGGQTWKPAHECGFTSDIPW
jgi:hypothetical protein